MNPHLHAKPLLIQITVPSELRTCPIQFQSVLRRRERSAPLRFRAIQTAFSLCGAQPWLPLDKSEPHIVQNERR